MPELVYLPTGNQSISYSNTAPQAPALFEQLRLAFPWVVDNEYRAISTEYVHEVLNERVIRTCVVIKMAQEMLEGQIGSAHRLFGLDSLTSVFVVTRLFTDPQPSWAPDESFVLAYTEHHDELGRPCSPGMLGFSEYYFVCAKATAAGLGIDVTDADEDTLYAAVIQNGQVVGYRRYSHIGDPDNDLLENWQVLYMWYAKKARRLDLVRQLLSFSFMDEYSEEPPT